MSDTTETVLIKSDEHESGCRVINKSDFRDGEHVLFDAAAKAPAETKKAAGADKKAQGEAKKAAGAE